MISIDQQQVDSFAALLPNLKDVEAFDFCSAGEGLLFPKRDSTGVVDLFFFNASHQFGFWHLDGNRYARPMIARAGGIDRKGSDYVFYCTQRAHNSDPSFFSPEKLSLMSASQCEAIFQDDHGRNPLPMWPEHRNIIYDQADWFLQNRTTPEIVIAKANRARKPLRYLLEQLSEIPGYREDPLQKKAMLLAVILENRPEKFLKVSDHDSSVPIIDYHLQRSALRTGLIRIDDDKLRAKIAARVLVSRDEEGAIRKAAYQAIDQLVKKSGLSVAAVDYFFFTNRTRCPEMSAPKCEVCPVRDICKQETGLFQPVFRTTCY